ncbi:hypothetical protein [Candidatus Spongiihabitans sp.]|uniref:hypothetical protein n=1 Tax=Candidatus Spongiihabitans sp. TaxID=3101308 RepID=UPI003C7BD0FF
MNRTEPISHFDDWQLPMELYLANGETITCLRWIQKNSNQSRVFEGQWQSKSVLIKLLLGNYRSAYRAWREQDGHRILTALNIKTPQLYFCGRCDGGHAVVFEFLQAQALHELWQKQPSCRTQIAEWSINLFVKLHRNGYRHIDFHLNNFLAVGDVFYVVDTRSIRKVSHSLRTGTLLRVSKNYGRWQRHNLVQCFARFDSAMGEVMMDALRRGYPEAANDPELAPAIIHAAKRRAARHARRN